MASHAPAPAHVAAPRRPWGGSRFGPAHLLVLLVSLGTLALFVLAIPARTRELATLCLPGRCALGQVSANAAGHLPSAGYVAALIGGETLFAALYLLVATVIFWRRPRNPMALFVSGMLVLWGLTFPPTLAALVDVNARWFWPVACARFAGAAALTLFFYVFPDGRFRPHVAWLLAALWIGSQIPHYFQPGTLLDPSTWSPALFAVVSAGFLAVMVALQVARYRRSSNAVERRQTKWVVLGIVYALLGYAALLGVAALIPQAVAPGSTGYVLLTLGEEAAVALIPICIGIAILRDRLYDIDLLLNRALVYGSLSVLLTSAYFVVVIALQAGAQALTRGAQRDEPLAIVISTLAIAAAFQPLRARLQRTIDRRFFRTRYDSARMLAEVAEFVRTEVDLNVLAGRLVRVVDRAFEPTHVSLWLRPLRDDGERGDDNARPKTHPKDWSRTA